MQALHFPTSGPLLLVFSAFTVASHRGGMVQSVGRLWVQIPSSTSQLYGLGQVIEPVWSILLLTP